jgi:hypothetical protein
MCNEGEVLIQRKSEKQSDWAVGWTSDCQQRHQMSVVLQSIRTAYGSHPASFEMGRIQLKSDGTP